MSQFLASHAQFIGKGYCYGKLYMISWFPGAILSNNTSEKVHGMLFKIKNPETVFKALDDYEGVDEHLFKRVTTTAFVNNKPIPTWVYVYNYPTTHLKLITSGDYLKNN
ncbi:gamma-glutamylcyclotransferase [Flaviramulus sp. BrNp1-15]|uniref:gamma-glutamylcyclotransferase family protein n=1 Tax=Flaviramulus sp. BrNp1-15 TaxID=2916754 RepID=UPI001EE89021|nr:gamma-glutamylcyclotransferase family protein [Flaviramulus sp. BrNp1-15]ULC58463.1 gamma-glutamylcyclotransferase [Flaviramulus sp. BrNp1-15]